jgi:hypothetical protein
MINPAAGYVVQGFYFPGKEQAPVLRGPFLL